MLTRSLRRVPRRRCPFARTANIVAALATSALAPVATATPPDCQTRWLDGVPTSDIGASPFAFGVRALTVWDPDGNGSEPARLVAGGEFDAIGGIGSPQVAAWVPGDRTFTGLGDGFLGPGGVAPYVTSVVSVPNAHDGQTLYAAGRFIASSGEATNGIARWDGSNWQPLGSGLGPIVPVPANVQFMMAGSSEGNLVVAGSFSSAGGSPASGLAQWDGTNWSTPATVAGGGVSAVAYLPDNSLLIGGSFTSVNGQPIARIARIADGVVASMSGEQIGSVTSLAVTSNGTVYATSVSPSGTQVVRYTDGSWAQIGAVTTTAPFNLGSPRVMALADNSIAIFGTFSAIDGVPMSSLARFDGVSWARVGSPESPYAAAQLPDGRIVTARTNLQASEVQSTSSLLGQVPQLTNGVALAVEYFEGDLVVAGNFTAIQGVPVTNVARRTASGWQQMGSLQGVTDLFNRNGTLYAAGLFAGNVARWTGEQWVVDVPAPAQSTLPAGSPDYHLSEHNGELLLTYYDGLCRFLLQRESGWHVLPTFFNIRMGVQVASVEGRLYSGGSFSNLLREFNGTQWVDILDPAGRRILATSVGVHDGRLFICYPTLGQQYGSRNAFTIAFRMNDSFVPVGFAAFPIRQFHSTANGDLYCFSEGQVIYRVRDGMVAPVIGGIGVTQWSGSHACDIATDESGRVVAIRHYFPNANTFAEFLDPRAVALRDVPTEAPVCADGRADVSIRVLGTLDRTLHWQWNGSGDFEPIADGFVAGLGVVSGSETDTLLIDQADPTALGTMVRLVASDACNTATSEPIILVPGSADTYACARCAPCAADFDQDGAPTPADIAAFVADFRAGLPCADVDRDGGITGADIGAFFLVFEAGGC